MTTETFFNALQTSDVSQYITHFSSYAGAIAQLLHILGFLLILTSILLVNLRLLGLGLRQQSVSYLAQLTNPLIFIGLGLTLLSGLFILIPSANLYYVNPAFWLKLGLLIAALLIQLTLYRVVYRLEHPHPALAGLTAILNLTLWFGVAFTGRAIGFLN